MPGLHRFADTGDEHLAHQVRLDASDQRHADDNFQLPTVEDAKQAIEFTKTLAEVLFVLPSKVTRGTASRLSIM